MNAENGQHERIVPIRTERGYDVVIGRGLLGRCGQAVSSVCPRAARAAIVSDDRVFSLYGQTVRASLEQAGLRTAVFCFPHGEESKSTDTLVSVLNFLAQEEFTRTDVVVALGGGVTGDLAGLAAAVYLRGVEFVQLPTTLLAAVDSSVGGKTAVNLRAGKNLCGAFHQPSLVLCDCDTFDTLEDDIFRDGLSEAIKYGLLCDPALFAAFEAFRRSGEIEPLVARCVEWKNDYVAGDERDQGKRQFLNLGHTPAHAIEKLSHFATPHGHAVAIGMAIMARASERLGLSQEPFSERLCALLCAQGLPVSTEFSAPELAHAALSDKKRRAQSITLVLPVAVGKCVLHDVSVDDLSGFFAAGLAE